MAGGFSAGLAGLSAAYPAYVQGQSDQYDLKNKALDMAAANALSQVLGGTSLGMPSPQPSPPGQASQPEPQAPPPPMQGGQPPPPGPPVSQAPGRMPFMGGQVPQFGGPPGQVNPGPPQQMPQMPPTQAPSPGGLPVGGIGRGPSPMGPQGFGPQAAAPQPQGQPPMSPGMGAGAGPPGGAAPPGGQQGLQGALTLQSFTQRWQQAAQQNPQINQPGLFIHALKQIEPILGLADREKALDIQLKHLDMQANQFNERMAMEKQQLELRRAEFAERANRESPEGQAAIAKAKAEAVEPTRVRQNAEIEFGPKGQTGRQLGAIEVARQHMSTLLEAGEALKNDPVKAVNFLKNWVSDQFGGVAPNDFEGIKQLVANEIIKGTLPSGGGVQEREKFAQRLSASTTPAAFIEQLKTVDKLMNAQVDRYRNVYVQSGLGSEEDFNRRYSKAVKGSLASEGGEKGVGFTGRTAINKKTGETLRETSSGDWVK